MRQPAAGESGKGQPAPSGRMRIARFLAAAGIASRRASEGLVSQGLVEVNGERISTPAITVDPDQDRVRFRGKPVQLRRKVYLALNKPVGYTCSAADRHAEKLFTELLPDSLGRLFSVGRLDRDSEGLLLVTNDGDFAQALSHPSNEVEKRYRVWCRGDLSSEMLRHMCRGVEDQGEWLQARRATRCGRRAGDSELELVLVQGRKREIRRLCERLGLTVTGLKRVAVGPLELGDLASGQWRHLHPGEITAMQGQAGKPTSAKNTPRPLSRKSSSPGDLPQGLNGLS